MEAFASVCKKWFSYFILLESAKDLILGILEILPYLLCLHHRKSYNKKNEWTCLFALRDFFLQFIVVPTMRSYLNRKYIIISIERVCVCTLFIQDVVIFSFPSSKFRQVKRIQTIIFVIFLLCVNSSHIYII